MVLRLRENMHSPVVARYRSLQDEDLDFENLLSELEAPAARLLEAAALFLVELAKRGDISLPKEMGETDGLRRLGFIADRLGENPDLGTEVRCRLKTFADQIYEQVRPISSSDLGFSKSTSKGRIYRLRQDADEIAQRWKVWGQVELRLEFLL